MEYQGNIGLYLSGCQIPIKTCGVFLTQPKVRDIVQFGEDDFFATVNILDDIKSFVDGIREGNSVLANKSDFQIFIGVLGADETSKIRQMFDSFMRLCFESFIVEITKKSINFRTDVDGPVIGQINPFNIREFSNTVKEVFVPYGRKEEEIEYNIDEKNQAAVRLRNKILANRKKREKAMQEQSSSGTSVFAQYISVLSIGLGMDVNTFYDYTPFQLYDAFLRYTSKINYDTYQSIITTPFVDTSKIDEVDNWLGDIYKPKQEVYNSMADIGKMSAAR